MFNVNDKLLIIIEGVANVMKGEEVLVTGQSPTELLVSDQYGNQFKLKKSGLGVQFMVSSSYEPDITDVDDDPTQSKYDVHFLDIDLNRGDD